MATCQQIGPGVLEHWGFPSCSELHPSGSGEISLEKSETPQKVKMKCKRSVRGVYAKQIITQTKQPLKDSVAVDLPEFQHISTYRTSSGRNAAAWLSLCPSLKPKQGSGHRGLLLSLGTLFGRRKAHALRNAQEFPLHSPLATWHVPLGQQTSQSHPSRSGNGLLCPALKT